jgi:hypothetical protein
VWPLPLTTAATFNADEVKRKFSAGGWTDSYGKRLWDSQSVVSVVGFFFPATAPAAAAALNKFISEQARSEVAPRPRRRAPSPSRSAPNDE